MVAVAAIMAAIAGACIGWICLRVSSTAHRRYRNHFGLAVSGSLAEFFLFLDPARVWVVHLALCVGFGAIALLLSGSFVLMLMAAGVALAIVPCLIARARRARLRRYEKQLPDFLMALAGALRAGTGLQAALSCIVPRQSPPLSQEFGLLLRQQRMGLSFDDALADLLVRMPTDANNLLVSSLRMAWRSGGSLAALLDILAETLRSCGYLSARVRALTSQGKMQAYLMAGMPLMVGAALYLLDPDSMRPLWQTPPGWMALGLLVLLEAAGLWFIRRIVDIRV